MSECEVDTVCVCVCVCVYVDLIGCCNAWHLPHGSSLELILLVHS